MPKLRQLLEEAGFDDVRTYLQSGNVVLSRTDLAKVVQRNPLGKVAKNPKRYQVSFLAAKPGADVKRKLTAAAVEPEQFVVSGREIYAWHPDGVARSKLWALLAGRHLGVT